MAASPPSRKLTLFDASMLVMGGILGVGIFFTPQRVAAHVGDPGTFLALWAVGGVLALAGALTFAELAGSFPRSGGWFVFLREAFGPLPAFLFAWIVLFVVSTGAVAVVAAFCVARLSELAGGLGAGGERAAGIALLVGLTGVSLTGVKSGARLQSTTMVLKLGTVLVLCVATLFALGGERGAPAAAPLAEPGGGVVPALLSVLFAVGGWQLVTYIAPTVRDPERNVPRALWVGVGAVVLVYLAFNASALAVLGIDELAARPDFASAWARAVLGEAGGTFAVAAMALSAFGVCAAIILATPGLYVAMAREGLFVRTFGEVHPRTGAPVRGLLTQCGVALVYFLWRDAAGLADAVVFAEWIFHVGAALALLRLRARRPELPRPFRSPLYPLAPAVYLALALVVVVGSLLLTPSGTTALGIAVLAAGALVYPVWRRVLR